MKQEGKKGNIRRVEEGEIEEKKRGEEIIYTLISMGGGRRRGKVKDNQKIWKRNKVYPKINGKKGRWRGEKERGE